MAIDLASPPTTTQLPLIADAESSGGRNVWGPQTDSGQAQGDYQITTGTWRDFAPKAGVDLSKYPDPNSAPAELQAQVAKTIPLGRWDPRTLAKLPGGADYAASTLNIGGMGNMDALAADYPKFQAMIGKPDSSWMAPTITALKANLVAQKAELEGINRQTDAAYAADRKRASDAYDAASKDDTTPWTQKPPPPETLQAFASAGSIFAAIASAFTRTPAISAMNGMAAAINARRDGNQKAYDEAYKVWQGNTKLAIDRQKMASDRLTQALTMMQTDTAHGFALAKQVMTEHGDQQGLLMLEAGMYHQLDQANQARDRSALQMTLQYQKILHPNAKSEILTDPGTKDENGNPVQYIRWSSPMGESWYTTMTGDPFTPKGAIKVGTEKTQTPGSLSAERNARFDDMKKQAQADGTYTNDSALWDKINHEMFISKSAQFSPGVAEMVADQIIAGNVAAASGFGRSPQLLAQLDNALTKRMAGHDPPLTGADIARLKVQYAAYSQGAKAFEAGGKLEPTVRSLNVVTQHLDVLAQAAQALAQNDTPALNALQNTLAREVGMSGPVTFDAIKGIVSAEIEKAVSGSAGAVTDREDLKANLNKSLNPDQLADVINGYEHLMAGQINGLSQTYDRTQKLGGLPGGDFGQKFLSPQTREIVASPAAPAAQTAPAAGTGGRPQTVFTITRDQFQGLPSGTWFRLDSDPPGKHRVKP